MRIVAIDFETANYSPVSACAVGLAVFDQHELMESPYWLVKPPKGYGWFKQEWTEEIHGISWLDVRHAPGFDQIAPEILARLRSADCVIAHNARFDLNVLRHLLDHFQIPHPAFAGCCTLALARRVWPALPNHQLSTLAAHIGCELDHHHARSDAIAAGRVLLAGLEQRKTRTPQELQQQLGLEPLRF